MDATTRSEVLQLLEWAWEAHPTLTLGQVVDIAARMDHATGAWSTSPTIHLGLRRLINADATPYMDPRLVGPPDGDGIDNSGRRWLKPDPTT